jgi:hypothetical protein
LVLLLLTGCVWTDAEPVPLVPTVPGPEESPPDARTPRSSTIVYSVEGTGTASISYTAVQAGSIVQQSSSGTPLPFTKAMTVSGSESVEATVLTLIAVGNQDTDAMTCTIMLDGEVVAEQASSGPFATVTCNASAARSQ